MAQYKSLIIENLEELRKLEKVSPEVSEQYVPIYTTKIIEELTPEFEVVNILRVFAGRNRHEVTLRRGDDYVVIENSYDRSRSFRLSFLSKGILIPLDLEKIIHRGENAKNLTEDILVNKDKVIEALENAKTIVETLRSAPITKKHKKEILNIVFERFIKKGYEIDITIADSYKNFFDYIGTVVERYIDGDYYYEGANNKVRKGRKVKSRFLQLSITNKVYNYLKETHPAVFI
jgi:hypothetical protein